eukprot:CAMPEP_0182422584 /NCGR_PEP_ID=MMETSP1167-20130531/8304_1 /TAXON_ID=2988 /ORGANISM="Mallomonas Sp, Strain CCMP3275" /LENGTH=473 /DNA_ID=CAMNT_0024600753 /DNA_START=51 /DNA_END=1472 /DNA_ORIENTATION=-
MAAKKSFDYSKWDNIELSDDESDLHPNIDKDSWFRMKHRTRLEREAKEDEEIKLMAKQNETDGARLSIIKARLNNLKGGATDEDAEFEDLDALQGEADELEGNIAKRTKKTKDYMDRRAWNIDNICKVKEEKSVINDITTKSLRAEDFQPTGLTEQRLESSASKSATKSAAGSETVPPPPSGSVKPAASVAPPAPPSTTAPARQISGPLESNTAGPGPQAGLRDRLSIMSYNDFVLSQEQVLETYSVIHDLEDTQQFLFKNCDVLLHEHSQSYMLLSCLEDEMNGKHKRMKLVCRQSQILSHIQELANSMHKDPRDVIIPFFRRIEEKEHFAGFTSAVNDFIERIKKRAVEKRREMDLQQEAEEQKRKEMIRQQVEAGGLDPYEVLQGLPEPLRLAFESQDIERLQKVLGEMDPMEAKRCMKLCVDSGLWVPKDSSVFEEDGEDFKDDEEEDLIGGVEPVLGEATESPPTPPS